MNNKNLKHKCNLILFTSIISSCSILTTISTRAMPNKNFGKGNVSMLTKHFQSLIDNSSPKISSIKQTQSKLITTNPTTFTSTLKITLKSPTESNSNRSITQITSTTSSQTKQNFSLTPPPQTKPKISQPPKQEPIPSASSDEIFKMYTSGSKKNSLPSKSATKKDDGFKLSLTENRDKSLPSVIYSKKDLSILESKIRKFTTRTISKNLAEDEKNTKILFDPVAEKQLNLALSNFVYKSAIKTIYGGYEESSV